MCQQGLSDIVMLVLNIIINVDPGPSLQLTYKAVVMSQVRDSYWCCFRNLQCCSRIFLSKVTKSTFGASCHGFIFFMVTIWLCLHDKNTTLCYVQAKKKTCQVKATRIFGQVQETKILGQENRVWVQLNPFTMFNMFERITSPMWVFFCSFPPVSETLQNCDWTVAVVVQEQHQHGRNLQYCTYLYTASLELLQRPLHSDTHASTSLNLLRRCYCWSAPWS